MGNICTSCYTGTTTTTAATTVNLILSDGQLREFRSPVKVFMVGPKLNTFICNAYEMEFDSYVKAISKEDELYPGQLYFELPESWLNRRLAAEDLASLAVKAGKAAMISSGVKLTCGGCFVKRVDPLMFCDDDDEMITSSWTRVGGGDDGNHRDGGRRGSGGGGRGSGGKGRMFTRLERIEEE